MLQENVIGVVTILTIIVGLFLFFCWSLRGGLNASRITRTKPDPDDDGLFLVRSPSSSRVRAIRKGNDSTEYDKLDIHKGHKKPREEIS